MAKGGIARTSGQAVWNALFTLRVRSTPAWLRPKYSTSGTCTTAASRQPTVQATANQRILREVKVRRTRCAIGCRIRVLLTPIFFRTRAEEAGPPAPWWGGLGRGDAIEYDHPDPPSLALPTRGREFNA